MLRFQKYTLFFTFAIFASCTSFGMHNKPNSQDYLTSELCYAAFKGDLPRVKNLISSGAEVKAKDLKWDTALHNAAGYGHFEVVKYLIQQGADVDAKNQAGLTPLHEAATGGHLEIVKYLIEKGAHPEAQDKRKFTPLYNAAASGKPEVIKYLIMKVKVAVDTVNIWNATALHIAACNSNLETIEALLEPLVSQVKQKNRQSAERLLRLLDLQSTSKNKTALDFASDSGKEEIAAYLKEIALLSKL